VDAAGGRLYLSGVDGHVRDQLVRTGKIDAAGPVGIYPATDIIGASTRQALGDAEAWLVRRRGQEGPEDAPA